MGKSLLGLVIAPKTGELCMVVQEGGYIEVRSLTGTKIGEGYFDSSTGGVQRGYGAPVTYTDMPRVHTPNGSRHHRASAHLTMMPRAYVPNKLADAYRGGGYGTSLYTGLCLASHLSYNRITSYSFGGGLDDGICSAPNQHEEDGYESDHQRSASATAWWSAAANNFGLVERVTGGRGRARIEDHPVAAIDLDEPEKSGVRQIVNQLFCMADDSRSAEMFKGDSGTFTAAFSFTPPEDEDDRESPEWKREQQMLTKLFYRTGGGYPAPDPETQNYGGDYLNEFVAESAQFNFTGSYEAVRNDGTCSIDDKTKAANISTKYEVNATGFSSYFTGTYQRWVADKYPYSNAIKANLIIATVTDPVPFEQGSALLGLDFDVLAEKLQFVLRDGKYLFTRANYGLLSMEGIPGKKAMEVVLGLARLLDIPAREMDDMKFRYLGGIGVGFDKAELDPSKPIQGIIGQAGFQPGLPFEGPGVWPGIMGLLSKEKFLERGTAMDLPEYTQSLQLPTGRYLYIAPRAAWLALFGDTTRARVQGLTRACDNWSVTPQGGAYWKKQIKTLERGGELEPEARAVLVDWIYAVDENLRSAYEDHKREYDPEAAAAAQRAAAGSAPAADDLSAMATTPSKRWLYRLGDLSEYGAVRFPHPGGEPDNIRPEVLRKILRATDRALIARLLNFGTERVGEPSRPGFLWDLTRQGHDWWQQIAYQLEDREIAAMPGGAREYLEDLLEAVLGEVGVVPTAETVAPAVPVAPAAPAASGSSLATSPDRAWLYTLNLNDIGLSDIPIGVRIPGSQGSPFSLVNPVVLQQILRSKQPSGVALGRAFSFGSTPSGSVAWEAVADSLNDGYGLTPMAREEAEDILIAALAAQGYPPARPNPARSRAARTEHKVLVYSMNPNAEPKVTDKMVASVENLAAEWRELGWDRFADDDFDA